MAETKLEAHPHPLIFSESPPSAFSFCAACRELIRGASYRCETCRHLFHKDCLGIPPVLLHPFHLTHPLSLFVKQPDDDRVYACRFCSKSSFQLFYNCSVCDLFSCIKCSVVKPPGRVTHSPLHQHPFTALVRPISFTCDACGEVGDSDPHVCNLCDLMLHQRCADLLPTLRISRHSHPVSHTFFLRDRDRICDICQQKMDPKYGAYRCLTCDYVAHAGCASDSRTRFQRSSMEDEEKEAESVEGGARVLKHFSHPQHHMRLNEYKVGDGSKSCRGCVVSISGPFYGCASCDFFLHKKCAQLPRRIQHVLHDEHPLVLQPTCTKRISFRGVFQCDACYELCNGFCYSCCEESCNFTLDIRCGTVSQPFDHDSHHHPLFFIFDRNMKCDACGLEDLPLLRCASDCSFTLDFLCATLPQKAMHKYDDHDLSMCCDDTSSPEYDHEPSMFYSDRSSSEADNDPSTSEDDRDLSMFYSERSSSNPYWCEICETKTNRKLWFYTCDDCGFTPHIRCVLPSHPFVRLGDAIRHEAHPHDLILTSKKPEEDASCFFNGKYCDDGLLFKCSDPGCSFAGCIFCLYSKEHSLTF